MSWQVLVFCLIFGSSWAQTTTDSSWDYEREGPDMWYHWSATCDGQSQSPVNIDTLHATFDPQLAPLSLNGYISNTVVNYWNFTHDGHTIVAYPPPLAVLSISGANLPETFYLDHFRLHWGYNVHQGSEHTIDGQKYPLEIQFVHRGRFSNRTAILSVLFNGQSADNPYLAEFLSIVSQVTDPSVAVQQQCDLSPLFPLQPTTRFYRYDGSWTTPPCTEGVMWFVLDKKVPISSRQLQVFVNNSIPVNYRPTQKLYARKVYANFRQATGGHGGDPSPGAGADGAGHGDPGHGGGGGGGGEGGHSSASVQSFFPLLSCVFLVSLLQ